MGEAGDVRGRSSSSASGSAAASSSRTSAAMPRARRAWGTVHATCSARQESGDVDGSNGNAVDSARRRLRGSPEGRRSLRGPAGPERVDVPGPALVLGREVLPGWAHHDCAATGGACGQVGWCRRRARQPAGGAPHPGPGRRRPDGARLGRSQRITAPETRRRPHPTSGTSGTGTGIKGRKEGHPETCESSATAGTSERRRTIARCSRERRRTISRYGTYSTYVRYERNTLFPDPFARPSTGAVRGVECVCEF